MSCFLFNRTIFLFAVVFGIFFYPVRSEAEELIIVSPHWEGFKREFEWAFSNWYKDTSHQEVTIRWIDVGGASDILKYLLSRHAQGLSAGVDLIFGGGVDVFTELKAKGLLEKVNLPAQLLEGIPETVQGNPVFDPEGYWYSVNLAGFGIAFNRPLLRRLKVQEPASWDDLGNPELRGWVGSADPRKSGSVRFIYELLLQYYGWEEGWKHIYEIASNVRTFSTASAQTPKDISLGEVAEGMLIDSYGRDLIRLVGSENVGLTIPSEIPSVFGDGSAVLSDAPHKSVAVQFLSFALSASAQQLLLKKVGTIGGPRQYELGRLSVRPDAYHPESPDEVGLKNPYERSSSFRYDPIVASHRWRYVTALLGAIAVDLQYELDQARYEKKMILHNLPAPLSEQELHAAVRSGANPLIVSAEARSRFKGRLGIQKNEMRQIFTLLLALIILATISIKTFFGRYLKRAVSRLK